jgi:hypothetical protein
MPGTAITPIAKTVTQFIITGVQVDTNALTMTIFVQRQDAGGNMYDTQTVIVSAAQFDAAWTGHIATTIVALAAASPKVTT